MRDYNYTSDGYIERSAEGKFDGCLKIEHAIDISPIEGQYFKDNGEMYLWLKRKPMLRYDFKTETYNKKEREPKWECYLQKQVDGNTVAYKGTFVFLHFVFNIVGVWDDVLGIDNKRRLNLYVDRKPLNEQTIINRINERKKDERGKREQGNAED